MIRADSLRVEGDASLPSSDDVMLSFLDNSSLNSKIYRALNLAVSPRTGAQSIVIPFEVLSCTVGNGTDVVTSSSIGGTVVRNRRPIKLKTFADDDAPVDSFLGVNRSKCVKRSRLLISSTPFLMVRNEPTN